MRKIKKVMALALTVVLGAAFMAGCGEKKTEGLTPEQSIKILIDVNIFGKKDDIAKVGVSDTQFETLQITKRASLKKSFEISESLNKINISDDNFEKFAGTFFEALSKAEIRTGKVNIEDNNATLELMVKGIDKVKLSDYITNEVVRFIVDNPNISQDEINTKFIESYINGLKSAEILPDEKVININMINKGAYWNVADSTEIEKILNALLTF